MRRLLSGCVLRVCVISWRQSYLGLKDFVFPSVSDKLYQIPHYFLSITVSHCSSEDELGHKTRSGTKISFVSPAVIYSSAISAKPTVIILKSM